MSDTDLEMYYYNLLPPRLRKAVAESRHGLRGTENMYNALQVGHSLEYILQVFDRYEREFGEEHYGHLNYFLKEHSK